MRLSLLALAAFVLSSSVAPVSARLAPDSLAGSVRTEFPTPTMNGRSVNGELSTPGMNGRSVDGAIALPTMNGRAVDGAIALPAMNGRAVGGAFALPTMNGGSVAATVGSEARHAAPRTTGLVTSAVKAQNGVLVIGR